MRHAHICTHMHMSADKKLNVMSILKLALIQKHEIVDE